MATLFASMVLLQGVDADMFDHLLCKFDPQFGHVQFGVDQEVGVIRFVMSIADCFYSLIDDRGFSDALFWGVEPMVRDPEQFVAGGVHEPAAKQAWAELPGVSSYVLHLIQHKVLGPQIKGRLRVPQGPPTKSTGPTQGAPGS